MVENTWKKGLIEIEKKQFSFILHRSFASRSSTRRRWCETATISCQNVENTSLTKHFTKLLNISILECSIHARCTWQNNLNSVMKKMSPQATVVTCCIHICCAYIDDYCKSFSFLFNDRVKAIFCQTCLLDVVGRKKIFATKDPRGVVPAIWVLIVDWYFRWNNQ